MIISGAYGLFLFKWPVGSHYKFNVSVFCLQLLAVEEVFPTYLIIRLGLF